MAAKAKKTRKPRAKALVQGDYVRGPARPLVLEPGWELNDIAADMRRVQSLARVIEDGVHGMPADILTTGNLMSVDIGQLATVAVRLIGEIIERFERLEEARG